MKVSNEINSLVRKLRDLKKLERHIRFGDDQKISAKRLVWKRFFNTENQFEESVKYNLFKLMTFSHNEMREAFSEYFACVYYEYYRENGIVSKGNYNPELLEKLGLSAFASFEDIKKKFRLLAMRHHPDRGGDAERFIDIMEAYENLKEK